MRLVFIVNLIFTYPLAIYPTNMIIEGYLFKGWAKTKKRQWSKNLYRTLMVLFTMCVSCSLHTTLDKFVSLVGALCCVPIAFTLPTMFHLKLLAKTRCQIIFDYILIVVSIMMMIFSSVFTILTWNE